MRPLLYSLLQYAMIAAVMACFARVAFAPLADADVRIINQVGETIRNAAHF